MYVPTELVKGLSSIPSIAGTPNRTIHVFISADCSYCKEFEEVLGSANDLRIHRYLLPAHSAAGKEATTAIWCAEDRMAAWRQVSSGRRLPAASCSMGAVDENLAAVRQIGIDSTPAIIAPNGSLREGYMDAEELEAFLNANSAN
jgi:thiol:disulfide interchange protein DsbC